MPPDDRAEKRSDGIGIVGRQKPIRGLSGLAIPSSGWETSVGPAASFFAIDAGRLPPSSPRPPFVSPFVSPRTKPIRVGLTMPDFAVGGVASVTRLLADAIASSADVELAGIAAWHDHFTADQVLGMFEGVPHSHGRDGVRALAEACDVLICSGSPEEGLWTDGMRCRRILVSHGVCGFTRNRVAWAAQADALAAVSASAASTFPGNLGNRAAVIPNPPLATVPRRSRAEVRREWSVDGDAWIVGYVGRMSPEKRPWAFLDALHHLPHWWRVALIGPYPERAETWIESREVRERVILPGPTDDPAGAMLACDAVALASEVEGWPVVSSEAWWLGVPHLSTPVGAAAEYPEFVRLLPPDADGQGIANALLADHRDPMGTRMRALAAQAWARTALSPVAFGERWLRLIRETAAIERTRPTSPSPATTRPKAPPRPPTSPQEPALPPVRSMALSAAKAAGRAAAAVLEGRPVRAPRELEDRRLSVCWGGAGLEPSQTIEGHCDHYRPSDGRCGSWEDDGTTKEGCGCFLTAKAKLLTEDCPAGRWPKA
jgi:glycosyltransferase involved in cell wall biosynthesis